MELGSEPEAKGLIENEDKEILLEEYRQLVGERRFVMTRYMQTLIFYPVVMGYSFVELVSFQSRFTAALIAVFMLVANTIFLYGADKFRSMAYHALNREAVIAHHLRTQKPHPMLWGYYFGIAAVVLGYLVIIVVFYVKMFHPEWALVGGQLPPVAIHMH
jgi:hypothetical protein